MRTGDVAFSKTADWAFLGDQTFVSFNSQLNTYLTRREAIKAVAPFFN